MTSIFARFKSRSDGSGDDSSPNSRAADAHARRREQVRRAQRSHRERKAEYIRNLETEVAELRGKDAEAAAEIMKCKAVMERYKTLLHAHSIEIPIDIEVADTPTFMARIEVLGAAGGPQKLKATLPSPGSDLAQSAPFAIKTPGFSLNDPQVGIDFVLSLEQPCLSHNRTVNPEHGGDGHILQLQAPLVAHGPQHIKLKDSGLSAWPTGSTWEVPSIELARQLERLLAYSRQLNLHGELTPVMAWGHITQHPQKAAITRPKLNKLRDLLVTQIECYGFGAILGEQEFQRTLNQVLLEP